MKPTYSRALLPRQFAVIVRALSWDRELRHPSVREFLHALLASDLRREHAGEIHSASTDLPSKPVAHAQATTALNRNTATAAEKPEPKANVWVQPEAPHVAEPTVATQASEPPKRESNLKHEDVVRLKAAVAAAEAHAERIEHPERAAPKPREDADALAKFRGYVAGPMAQQTDDASDEIPPVVATDIRPTSEQPKTAKRIWPWQRSAWVAAALALGTIAFVAAKFDSAPEPITSAAAHPAPPAVAPLPVVKLASPAPESITPQVEEKKSPPAVATRTKPPVAADEISFATRTLHVGVGQTMAALAVKRSSSTKGRARVAWAIEGGTAKPGVDYQVTSPQVIEFLEGQSIRSLFIPLVADKNAGDARTSKTFTVKLQSMSGGPKVGDLNKVYVTIVGDIADERVADAD